MPGLRSLGACNYFKLPKLVVTDIDNNNMAFVFASSAEVRTWRCCNVQMCRPSGAGTSGHVFRHPALLMLDVRLNDASKLLHVVFPLALVAKSEIHAQKVEGECLQGHQS